MEACTFCAINPTKCNRSNSDIAHLAKDANRGMSLRTANAVVTRIFRRDAENKFKTKEKETNDTRDSNKPDEKEMNDTCDSDKPDEKETSDSCESGKSGQSFCWNCVVDPTKCTKSNKQIVHVMKPWGAMKAQEVQGSIIKRDAKNKASAIGYSNASGVQSQHLQTNHQQSAPITRNTYKHHQAPNIQYVPQQQHMITMPVEMLIRMAGMQVSHQ